MTNRRTCPQCGALLPPGAADWLCPKCLLGQAAAPEPTGSPSTLLSPLTTPHANPVLHSFGDYELLHEIARGGMGVVYKARQVPLNRVVAVKLLQFGPLAREEFKSRFRLEAKAAASLQHPNIVAIHEVGEHEGQPYFSMEYIEGTNLAELVLEKPLTAKRAAAYLKTIAEAIHYAHGRRVLHRDLKPSNILIDTNDQPRITDFGLAKRLAGAGSTISDSSSEKGPVAVERVSAVELLTVTGQVLGTPGFMSPEQAGGKRGATGEATDVYSLGALLYFLLTARAPFAADSLEATLAQVHTAEPVSPRLLNPAVRPDLETICLKCLSKEPSRRYASALAMAEDLGRWLKGEAIAARPATVVEKVWIWCRRRPAVATPLALSFLLLLAVAVGSSMAAARINRERAQAEAQARKSQQVSRFLSEMLQGIQPDVALGQDTSILREILDRTAQRLGAELKDQPEVVADLCHTIGVAYLNLDEPEKAETMHRESLRLRTAILGEPHPATLESMFRLAQSLHVQFRSEEPRALMRRALELHLEHWGENHLLVAELLHGSSAYTSSYDDGEKWTRRSLDILEKLNATNHPVYGGVLEGLARGLQLQERLAESEAMAQRAIAAQKRNLGDNHPSTASSLNLLASVLRESGKFEQAEAILEQAWNLNRQLFGELHPVSVRGQLELAMIRLDQNNPSAARPLLLQVLNATLGWTNSVPTSTASAVMGDLGYGLTEMTRRHWDQGEAALAREYALAAEQVLRRLVTARETHAAPTEPWMLWTRSLHAGALIAVATTDLEKPLPDRIALFATTEKILLDLFAKFTARSYPDAVAAYHALAPTQERLVALYLRWNETAPDETLKAKLAEWRQRLDELERKAGRKPAPRLSERYVPR